MRAGLLLPLILTVLAAVAAGHNGEYVSPEATRKPPPVNDGRSPGPPTSTPITPGTGPRIGVGTPRTRLSETPRTADPDAVVSEAPLDWKLVWEILRPRAVGPPPPLTAEQVAAVRTALRAALADGDVSVRVQAALSLSRLGDVEAVTRALREDLELNETVAVLAPGLALRRPGASGDAAAEALASLVPVLENPKSGPDARAYAALSAALTGAGAASRLLELSKGGSVLGEVARFGLGVTGHPGVRDVLVPAVLPPAPRPGGGAAGGAVGVADDPGRRAVLVHALSRLPGPEVNRDLVKRLGDPAAEVRAAAALSLASRADGGGGARLALRDHARRGGLLPRSAALLALVLSEDPQAAPAAREVLRDAVLRGTGFPALAALCLGLAGSVEDGPDFLEVFRNENLDPGLRAAAALATGLVRSRGTSREMAKLVAREHDPLVYGYSLVGLSLIDGAAAVELIRERLPKEKRAAVRIRMVTALGIAGGTDVADLLVASLGDDYFVNREAARALFRVDPERAIAACRSRLAEEKNPWARRFGAFALGLAGERGEVSFFGEVLLGTGLLLTEPVPRLCLFLESEEFYQRYFGGR